MLTNNKQNPFETTLLDNEHGVAIITVLLILLLLTFIGITATNTTVTEKVVVRSDSVFEQGFYLAESAALEGVQRLVNESAPDELLARLVTPASTNFGLLYSADSDEPTSDLANLDSGNDGLVDNSDNFEVSEIDADNDTYRVVIQMPIRGSSLGMGASRLYTYTSYGYTEAKGGRSLIKVGYKRRF